MERSRKSRLNILWAALAIGVFYGVSNLMMYLGYVIVPKYFIAVKPEHANSYMLIMDVVMSAVLLAVSFIAYRKLNGKPVGEKEPVSGKMILKCIIMGAAIFGINTLLDMLLVPSAGSGTKESLLSMVITSVIFAPLIEELFFRGIVFNFLDRFKGGWVSIILSALIFGLYHADLYQALYAGILGIVLAFVYQRTEKIIYPIAIHMANNAIVCIVTKGIPQNFQMAVMTAALVMIIPSVYFMAKTKAPKGA